jgi:hypothetical protein|nr:MAG TPA: hypothetical protein [Caudoviricetes sp.]
MEKKTYISIIDKFIEVLDNDIDLFLECFDVNSRRHYYYIGERAEYYNIIRKHFVPIELLCEAFRWNITYIYLSRIFDKLILDFLDDYNILKEYSYYDSSKSSKSKMIHRRFEFREYLRFEFIDGLIKHLKEDAEIVNMYGDKQLKYNGVKKPEHKYRSIFISDIEKLLELKEIPESLYKQSLTVLSKYLISSKSGNKVTIDDIANAIKTDLNKHKCTDPAILKHLLVILLFYNPDEFNMVSYETKPGDEL